MKALTLSEAARRNFFEIQNSSSEFKVCLEVVGRDGIIDVSISKEMPPFIIFFFTERGPDQYSWFYSNWGTLFTAGTVNIEFEYP